MSPFSKLRTILLVAILYSGGRIALEIPLRWAFIVGAVCVAAFAFVRINAHLRHRAWLAKHENGPCSNPECCGPVGGHDWETCDHVLHCEAEQSFQRCIDRKGHDGPHEAGPLLWVEEKKTP